MSLAIIAFEEVVEEEFVNEQSDFTKSALSGGFLFGMAVAALAKRLGLAKAFMRHSTRRMFDEKVKARAFAGYVPTEHDVFVATFGKSGTNWMMQITQQIAYRGKAEFDHIHQVVPWPDAVAKGPVPLSDTKALDASPTHLRVIKTHLDTAHVPYEEKARYVSVLRDPKEVLVSSYYFLGGIMGVLDRLSIDDWFEIGMEEGALIKEWALHTAGFWDWRDRENVLVFGFGEIKREPRRCIEEVAQIMGVELSEDELAAVMERASFEYMKAHESQFAPPQSPFDKKGPPARMIRSGKTGASGELLTREQQRMVDRECLAELDSLGSDFPYADFFELA